MASTHVNLADRSGSLLESHKGYDPRILFFYFVLAALMLTLAIGLGYQQLSKTSEHNKAEWRQNHRRIVVPGPRGSIYDRNHKLLVGNRPRFAVRLHLDELRPRILDEYRVIRTNYRATGEKDLPSTREMSQIARVTVVQRYLDQVNAILGRDERVDRKELDRHFAKELLLPFTLIDDLEPAEYARLIERLPVNSPAQVYTSSTRYYPYGSAASHALGYVGQNDDVEVEDLPGENLKTFKMKGTIGRDGIEKKFDELLQGASGGAIFRVDPAGNRIHPPLEEVPPKPGTNIQLALDIDLQLAAEKELAKFELAGAAIALDVNTGEVLALVSKPDYDLNEFTPRLSHKASDDITARGAWLKRAIQGLYMPGSTFKILVTIAGFRSGVITPASMNHCPGFFAIGRRFACHDGHAHGDIGLVTAIEKSCNVYFYRYGVDMGPDVMAREARRFHLDQPTGIDLPDETRRMIIPHPEWKRKQRDEPWVGGDTANMSIGQGDVTVTPLQMACFAASVARDEVFTQPFLFHQPQRPRQQHERIGLAPEQRAVLLEGMEKVTQAGGTAKIFANPALLAPLPGLRVAGKTGTAQKPSDKGMLNFAWFIGFAPVDRPEIAFAVALEGDTPGEETGGGRYAGPVAHAILKAWHDKKTQPAAKPVRLKTE